MQTRSLLAVGSVDVAREYRFCLNVVVFRDTWVDVIHTSSTIYMLFKLVDTDRATDKM
jgi:hypothetical protein